MRSINRSNSSERTNSINNKINEQNKIIKKN
jgi:hypothetical protein